jgi:hypothetical protein
MSELTTLSLDRDIVDTVDELDGGTLPEVYRRLTAEGTRPHLRGQMVAIRWHRLLDAGVLEPADGTVHVRDRTPVEAHPQSST